MRTVEAPFSIMPELTLAMPPIWLEFSAWLPPVAIASTQQIMEKPRMVLEL